MPGSTPSASPSSPPDEPLGGVSAKPIAPWPEPDGDGRDRQGHGPARGRPPIGATVCNCGRGSPASRRRRTGWMAARPPPARAIVSARGSASCSARGRSPAPPSGHNINSAAAKSHLLRAIPNGLTCRGRRCQGEPVPHRSQQGAVWRGRGPHRAERDAGPGARHRRVDAGRLPRDPGALPHPGEVAGASFSRCITDGVRRRRAP